MRKYQIIEERGCDIEYCIFQGNYKDCRKEIEQILLDQQAEDPKSISAEYHDGNGFPYSYRVEYEEEIIIERHMALCYN